MKYLKLGSEYGCSPLWIGTDGVVYHHLDIANSPFGEELKQDLSEWAKKFEETLNQEYPPDSGFRTRQEAYVFEQLGFNIWKAIRQYYSSHFEVVYYKSYTLGKLYTDEKTYQNDLKSLER
jgi:hypothetical protein